MSGQNNIEKLLKLYALAMRGVDGERENARRLLNKLMEKSGITLEEIERAASARDDAKKWISITINKDIPDLESVMAQLIFSFGLRDDKTVQSRINVRVKARTKRGYTWEYEYEFNLSKAEGYLFKVFWRPCYDAYKKMYSKMQNRQKKERAELREKHTKEQRSISDAFIVFNHLYSSDVNNSCETTGEGDDEDAFAYNFNDIEVFDHEHESKLGTCLAQLEDRGAEQ